MAGILECFNSEDFKIKSTLYKRSKTPNLNEIQQNDLFLLAHGTSSVFFDDIIEDGLLPQIVSS